MSASREVSVHLIPFAAPAIERILFLLEATRLRVGRSFADRFSDGMRSRVESLIWDDEFGAEPALVFERSCR